MYIYMKDTLGPQRVRDVKTTTRLSDSPAIITDHESGALRRMMKMLVSNIDMFSMHLDT
jgi:HSP90 family molecular chaperone